MHFTLPLFVLLAAVSSTPAILIARQSLPSCAIPCMANANPGNCAPVDDSCLCKNAAFINSTTTCIQSSCTGSDLQNAESYAQQLCLAVGVTLTASSASATGTPATTSTTSPKATSSSSSSSSGAPSAKSISVFAGAVAVLVIAAAL